jgi:hypothetical protein
MAASPSASNPFVLMTNPEVVLQAVERSNRLSGLQRRICRPLDKPLIPRSGQELEAFDREVDAQPEPELHTDTEA